MIAVGSPTAARSLRIALLANTWADDFALDRPAGLHRGHEALQRSRQREQRQALHVQLVRQRVRERDAPRGDRRSFERIRSRRRQHGGGDEPQMNAFVAALDQHRRGCEVDGRLRPAVRVGDGQTRDVLRQRRDVDRIDADECRRQRERLRAAELARVAQQLFQRARLGEHAGQRDLPFARIERRHEDHGHRRKRRAQRRRPSRVTALDVGQQAPQMTRDRERRRGGERRRPATRHRARRRGSRAVRWLRHRRSRQRAAYPRRSPRALPRAAAPHPPARACRARRVDRVARCPASVVDSRTPMRAR